MGPYEIVDNEKRLSSRYNALVVHTVTFECRAIQEIILNQ
jgi:hypothetical protein